MLSKGTVKKVKTLTIGWKKIFEVHISDKGFIALIFNKNSYNLIIEQTTPILKYIPNFNRYYKRIYTKNQEHMKRCPMPIVISEIKL